MLLFDRRRKPRAVIVAIAVAAAFLIYFQGKRSPFRVPGRMRICEVSSRCSEFEKIPLLPRFPGESNLQRRSQGDIPSEEFDIVDFHDPLSTDYRDNNSKNQFHDPSSRQENTRTFTGRNRLGKTSPERSRWSKLSMVIESGTDGTNSSTGIRTNEDSSISILMQILDLKQEVVSNAGTIPRIIATSSDSKVIKSDESVFEVGDGEKTRDRSLDTRSRDAGLRGVRSALLERSTNGIPARGMESSSGTTSKFPVTLELLNVEKSTKLETGSNAETIVSPVIESNDARYLLGTGSSTKTVPRFKSNGISTEFQFVIDVSSGCDQQTWILIVVCSAPGNGKRRGLIRDTWAGFKHRKLRVLFLIGLPRRGAQTEEGSIRRESHEFGDLLQADFLDSYSNLSLKSLAMLQWTASNCQRIRFLVKADDDVLLNTPLLLRDLQQTRHRRFVMGNLVAGARPVRDPASKWYTPTSLYSGSFYPKYVSGAAYVISGDLVRELHAAAAASVEVFWIEDVFVTGLLVSGSGGGLANVQHIYNGKFDITKEINDPCLLQRHLLRHLADPNSIIGLWSKMTSHPSCFI